MFWIDLDRCFFDLTKIITLKYVFAELPSLLRCCIPHISRFHPSHTSYRFAGFPAAIWIQNSKISAPSSKIPVLTFNGFQDFPEYRVEVAARGCLLRDGIWMEISVRRKPSWGADVGPNRARISVFWRNQKLLPVDAHLWQ